MNSLKSRLGRPMVLAIVAGVLTFIGLQIAFGSSGAADVGAWQLFAAAAGAFGVVVCVLALSAMFGIMRARSQRNLRQ